MADQVFLSDGTEAWVWPLLPTDRARLAEEFEKLSPESRRLRFLTPVLRLSDAMLDRLVDGVDGIDHVALVLMAETPEGDLEPTGIARMVRYDGMPDVADLAVTVLDEWQGRGVASALLTVLLTQRPAGVTHILTSVATDNPVSLAMLARLGPTDIQDGVAGIQDVAVDLDGRGPHPDIVAGSERLHPVLEEPFREHLRGRDLVCPWLNPDAGRGPCGSAARRAQAPGKAPAS